MRVALLALALVAVFLPGAARAGCFPECYPAGDFAPQWSPDGSQIAFYRGAGSFLEGSLVRIGADGSGRVEVPSPASPAFPRATLFSPDLKLIAYPRSDGGIGIRAFEGGPERMLGSGTALPLAWSPDGARIAYTEDAQLVIARVDGGGEVVVPGLEGSVAWSPDGSQLAVVARSKLVLVSSYGKDVRTLADDVSADPEWSPDGSLIAFGHAFPRHPGPFAGAELFVVDTSGVSRRVAGDLMPGTRIAWSPDGSRLVYPGPPPNRGSIGAFGLELVLRSVPAAGGKNVQIGRGHDPAFSPDGQRLAFVEYGPCEGTGLYLAGPLGGNPRRVTSGCTVRGTRHADVIRGTAQSEEIVGLGGNDRLYGEQGHDWLHGGPGNDALEGDLGGDSIWGGTGHDRIDGGPGRDAIYAADGQRDAIRCGTNIQRHTWERDEVYADRFDQVARDCEIVHRP